MNQFRAENDQGSDGEEQAAPPVAAEADVSTEVERSRVTGETTAADRKGRRRRRRWPWLAGIALLALLAVGGLFCGRPLVVACYRALGEAYSDKGEYARAIDLYSRAIQLQPDDASLWFSRGFVYHIKHMVERSTRSLDLAIADHSQAIQLQPDVLFHYLIRGEAYYFQGNYDLAIADYDGAIQLWPEDPWGYYQRGLVHQSRGDLNRAVADYAKSVELSTNMPSVRDEAEEHLKALGAEER